MSWLSDVTGPVAGVAGGILSGAGGLAGGMIGGGYNGLVNKGTAPAPDFMGIANQQNNYSTPWGSLQNGQFTLPGDAQSTLQGLQSNMLRSSQMDPTQARNEAINSNLGYGMQMLGPELQKMQQGFTSGAANSGIDAGTPAYALANRELGNRMGAMYGGVLNNAINAGNATQQTQMAQSRLPFEQYGSLINSSLGRPSQPNLLVGAGLGYNADVANTGIRTSNKSGMFNGLASMGGNLLSGGKT